MHLNFSRYLTLADETFLLKSLKEKSVQIIYIFRTLHVTEKKNKHFSWELVFKVQMSSVA